MSRQLDHLMEECDVDPNDTEVVRHLAFEGRKQNRRPEEMARWTDDEWASFKRDAEEPHASLQACVAAVEYLRVLLSEGSSA